MHNNSYSINVASFCTKNVTNSLQEIKSFFNFKLSTLEASTSHYVNKNYNAVIIELPVDKNINLNEINIPKIIIQSKNEKKTSNQPFEINFKLPINVVEFNKAIVDLSKKYEFNKNSLIKIKKYILDKNERILRRDEKTLKITEKEIYFIETLHLSKKPLSKNYILKNIWSYSSEADTHTVETHIYRLRQKIKESFGDNNFIKNTSEGYSLWKKGIKLLKIYLQKNITKELLNPKKAKVVTEEKNLRKSSPYFLYNFRGHFSTLF